MINTRDFGHEALSRWIVERRAQSERERDHVDLRCRRDARYRQYSEYRGAQRQPGLSDLENLPLVEAIRDHPPVRGQEKHRQELQSRGDPDCEGRPAGKLEHQPVLRNALHPGADVGDERSRQIDAVVTLNKRGEHATARSRDDSRWCDSAVHLSRGWFGVDAHPWFSLSSTDTARRSASRSSWSSPAIRTASHSSRRRRFASNT